MAWEVAVGQTCSRSRCSAFTTGHRVTWATTPHCSTNSQAMGRRASMSTPPFLLPSPSPPPPAPSVLWAHPTVSPTSPSRCVPGFVSAQALAGGELDDPVPCSLPPRRSGSSSLPRSAVAASASRPHPRPGRFLPQRAPAILPSAVARAGPAHSGWAAGDDGQCSVGGCAGLGGWVHPCPCCALHLPLADRRLIRLRSEVSLCEHFLVFLVLFSLSVHSAQCAPE